MTVKATVFFQDNDLGWTETYFTNDIDPKAAISTLSTTGTAPPPPKSLGALVLARRGLMNSPAFVSHVRAADPTKPRRYYSFDYSANTGVGIYTGGTGSGNTAEPWTSLLIQMSATSALGFLTHSRIFVRSLPEEIINPPDVFRPTPKWNTAFAVYVAVLTSGNFLLQTRQSAIKPSGITSFNVSASGLTGEVQPVPGALAAGATGLAIIRAMRAPKGWLGTHPFTVANATLGAQGLCLRLGPTRHTRPSGPPWLTDPSGTVAVLAYDYGPIDTILPVRLVKKNTGRPFGLPRGRARVV